MNCEEATERMHGYLDGELNPITSQAIEQHLRGWRCWEQGLQTFKQKFAEQASHR
jgi:predicted anti-sigma-YlaC factor YlaD